MKMIALTSLVAALGAVTPALAQHADAGTPSTLIKAKTARQGDADGAFVDLTRFNEPTGETIYRRVCAGCHMSDANGAQGAGRYPALARNTNLAYAGYPLYIVLHGKKAMPNLGRMLTDEQVAEVVNYVRSNFGNTYKDRISAADANAVR